MKRFPVLSAAGCAAVCLALFLSAAGCRSEREYTDHSADPEAYAKRIKTMINTQLPPAKKAKDEPESYVTSVINELEDYNSNPVGSYGDTYAQLLEKCKELHQMLQSGGTRPATNDKIDEIVAVANTLPGEVPVETGD